jgi:hypothetical protein
VPSVNAFHASGAAIAAERGIAGVFGLARAGTAAAFEER